MARKIVYNRKQIFDMVNAIYPTYPVGQHYVHDNKPYCILKAMDQQSDIGNVLGGWQTYQIMCYVPDTSIALLDEMIKRIRDLFWGTREVEFIGELGQDFHETELRMYMRYVSFRVPKEV